MATRKEILELYQDGKGLKIKPNMRALKSGKEKVRTTIRHAADMDLTYERVRMMTADEVEAALKENASPKNSHEMPDFAYIARELDKKYVNKKLLWVEYCDGCAARGATPYQYSRFCELYKRWANEANVTTRLVHKPGFAAQSDWVGGIGHVTDKLTSEQHKAYFFVMSLPYSGRFYAEAFPDMKQRSWIAAHNHAYRYFGGVPAITIPDNLKCGVRTVDPYEPVINENYARMADHYGTKIVPADAYYPKGKAHVERSVKIVETWVIAYLRNKAFFTFAKLNEAICERIEELNDQVQPAKGLSRNQIFFDEEAEALLPLPCSEFELALWKSAKLQPDCHFQFERMRYSAPCAYIGRTLDLRVSDSVITVYCDDEMLCMHKRLRGRLGQYSTVEDHMPPQLRTSTHKLWSAPGFLKWAHGIGPSTEAAVRAILDSRKIEQQAYRSCRGIKSLVDRKGPQLVEEACSRALRFAQVPSYTQRKNILAAIEDEPLQRLGFDELAAGEIGDVGYLRDPGDYGKHRESEGAQ